MFFKNQKEIKGLIVVNKPLGLTSCKVVEILRKRLKIKKMGHAGTLDPMATGVLIILIGKATKKFQEFIDCPKEYSATLKLGESTDTGDAQGKVIFEGDYSKITSEVFKQALECFKGEIEQIPPMVSALRYKGRRLYELARKGITVERKPRKIKIYNIKLEKFSPPFVDIYIRCSKGTYVRKIAEDIGTLLGCGAHVVRITRLSQGPYRIEDAKPLEKIDEGSIISL